MSKRGDASGRGRTARWGRLLLVIGLTSLIPLLSGCLFVKPNPISDEEHWQRTLDDRSSLYWEQEHPAAPITLPEAVARAVKYNLDHRLALMEDAFQMNQLEVANLGLLPRLAVNAGYSWRTNENASSSISYRNRTESLEPSVSSDVWRWNSDLSFNWSLLDFGLSYFQAKQQADRFMIVKERRRRLVNNLIKDVIAEYFRVASAEVIGKQVEETLAKAEEALQAYQKIEAGKKGSPAQALEQQRALISIISNLRLVSLNLASAKSKLAALMNLPLSSQFSIVPPGEGEMKPPQLAAQLADLETIGIYLRPDLREETYQARIDKTEVKKDILRMVPMLNVFSAGQFDSNQYLVHQAWGEAGARLTQDLIGMVGKWKQVKASKMQTVVSRQRRLASTVAAMVQINLSYYQYQQAVELYQDSERLKDIDSRLLELSQAASKAREIGELEKIRQTAVALNTQLDRDRNLIEVLSAWGNLYFSVGGDILGKFQGTEDLATLTCVVAEALGRWLVGELPELPGDAPTLPGGSLAGGRYQPRAPLPPVLSVSEDIKRMAEEKAAREKAAAEKKAEEEKKQKGKKDAPKGGKTAKAEADQDDAAGSRPARARPEREAILKERQERSARGEAPSATVNEDPKSKKPESAKKPEKKAEAAEAGKPGVDQGKTDQPAAPPASPPGKAGAAPPGGADKAKPPAPPANPAEAKNPLEDSPKVLPNNPQDKAAEKPAGAEKFSSLKPPPPADKAVEADPASQWVKLLRQTEDKMTALEESVRDQDQKTAAGTEETAEPTGKQAVTKGQPGLEPQGVKLRRSPEEIMRELEESVREKGIKSPAEVEAEVKPLAAGEFTHNSARTATNKVPVRKNSPKARSSEKTNPRAEILQVK